MTSLERILLVRAAYWKMQYDTMANKFFEVYGMRWAEKDLTLDLPWMVVDIAKVEGVRITRDEAQDIVDEVIYGKYQKERKGYNRDQWRDKTDVL